MKRLHWILGLLLVASFASPSDARPLSSAELRTHPALAKLSRSVDAEWKLSTDDRTGAPSALFGSRTQPLAPVSEGPSGSVRRFLLDHSELFALRSGIDDCRFDRMIEQNGIRHFHMQQTYRGLPVFDAGYNVSLDDRDRIVMVTGCAEPELRGDIGTRIGQEIAERLACAAVPGGRLVAGETTRLGVVARDGQAIPAWEIAVEGTDPLDASRVRLDARSGAMLDRLSAVARYNGLANAFASYPGGSPMLPVTLPRLAGSGTTLTGDYVEVHNLSGADLTAVNGDFRKDASDSLAFAQAHAYYHADRFVAYLRGLGYSGPSVRVRIDVNNTNLADGAGIYTHFSRSIKLSRCCKNVAYDAGIVAHESWHFVAADLGFSYSGSIFGTTEAGALQEGLAQYFQADYSQDAALSVWSNGGPGCGLGGYYSRVANNPSSYFRMPNYNNLQVCGMPLVDDHTNGMIVTGAMWDLRTAIGAATTDQLALEAIPFLPYIPTVGCFFDALFEVDALNHGMAHGMAIVQTRANRYLNCKPVAEVAGSTVAYVNQPAEFHVQGVVNQDCGIVPFSATLWQRRPACGVPPCAPWTNYEDADGFTVLDSTVNTFNLRAFVMDAWGRRDTTDIITVHVYQPMTVSISGPDSVDVSDCIPKEWTAIASGHAPFTYRWSSPFGSYNGPTFPLIPTADFTLRLTVTDVDGQNKIVTKFVRVTGYCDLGGDYAKAGIELAPSVLNGNEAEIQLYAPSGVHARLEICDVAGRRAAVPFEGTYMGGTRQIRWNAGRLPSGVYFYRWTAGSKVVTQRFVIVH